MDEEYEITYEKWQQMPEAQFIDIREKEEREVSHIGGEWIPMATLLSNSGLLSKDLPVVLYCQSGRRSMHMTKALRQMLKREDIFSLKGGLKNQKPH